jgi:hypothetical protein
MIGHKAVGMKRAAFLADEPAKVMKVERQVRVIRKAGGTIVPALDGVHGNLGKHDPGLAGHSQSTNTARRR